MVRDITVGDLDKINIILQEFNYKISEETLKNKFTHVAVYDDTGIKGVIVYDVIYDRIEIQYIVVESTSRRNGIATELVKYVEQKNSSIKNITLEVRESNNAALSFYEKLGFKRVAIRKNYYGNENGILMIKLGE